LSEQDFASNSEKQGAVFMRLAIIGESVKQLPIDFRHHHPDIAW